MARPTGAREGPGAKARSGILRAPVAAAFDEYLVAYRNRASAVLHPGYLKRG